MFGNRGYRWKLAGTWGLVALLAALARSRGAKVDPPLWHCLAEPERWEGATLSLNRVRILSVENAEFRIETEGSQVQVRGRAAVQPGDSGSLEATFESVGPALRLLRWQPEGRRSGMGFWLFGLEMAALAAVVLNFARHFSFRPKVLQVKAAD